MHRDRLRRSLPVALVALISAVIGVSCGQPTTATGSPLARHTPSPELGLTWGLVQNVERPEAAFALPSDLPTGPAGPGTAGHPGHFPGQAILADVTARDDLLVAVGYVGVRGVWTANAWTSRDGIDWSVHAIDPRAASFAASVTRDGEGDFIAVGSVGDRAATWSSLDGAEWSPGLVASLDTETPERMTVLTPTSEGLIAGGSAGPELFERRARLWRSADGSDWAPLGDSSAFAGAEVSAIIETDAGYVAIGLKGSGQRKTGSLAWRSRDGNDWTLVDSPTLVTGLAVSLAATPFGLLAAGSDLDEREAVAWLSKDHGDTWLRAPREGSRLHSGEKIRMTDVLALDSRAVAVGNYVGVQFGTGTSWISSDGLHWTEGPDQPVLGQGEPLAVTAWRRMLVAVGSRGAPDNYIPSVWLSPDVPIG